MTVRKYVKKRVVVEAIKFTRQNFDEIREFTGGKAHSLVIPRHPQGKAKCKVDTLEGTHIATEGDYIIKDVKGEFYPCKPDIFRETYDLVEGED